MTGPRTLMIVENSPVPVDIRVWYEATTLRDAGWQVSVISPYVHPEGQADVAREILDGVEVLRFPLRSAAGGTLAYLREYLSAFAVISRLSWRVWRAARFDVIHLSNPPDIFFPLAWFYRLLGARVIFDHHDLFPEQITARYNGALARLLYVLARIMEFMSLHCAHVVISTNESYRRVATGRDHIRPERVVVVRNGPRLGDFVPVGPEIALKDGRPHMVCYAGVMGHEDGVLELVDVIQYCVQILGRDDILFALLGDGPVRATAQHLIRERGLEPWVEMPGMVDRPTLRRYIATADLCLSPEPDSPLNARSTFIKIGEYMAMAKPVVATDLAESRYTAQQAACYVTPGNAQAAASAITRLLDEPEARTRMGQLGRDRVENVLAWEHQQVRLLDAYRLALSQANPTQGGMAAKPMAETPCQLQSLQPMSESVLPDSVTHPLGRLKLFLKRRLSPQRKRAIKSRIDRFLHSVAVVQKRIPESVPVETSTPLNLQAGDRVRVRSEAEIRGTLDSFGMLRGCVFMPEMAAYCDTIQRVLKPVEVFLDERDYRRKKTRGIVLLENAICEGTAPYGRCDRSCYFFWREDWLERVEAEPG